MTNEELGPDVAPVIISVRSEEYATTHLRVAHIATLPDGSLVALPAGTILREAEVVTLSLPSSAWSPIESNPIDDLRSVAPKR